MDISNVIYYFFCKKCSLKRNNNKLNNVLLTNLVKKSSDWNVNVTYCGKSEAHHLFFTFFF